ncbi:hypothetical protein COV18_02405 [Candidatus Woesearchaeota archaeon CG10_big_fil_rev_8_21_14_0_10_37_12]|nr:MAG: hypothetical protein COV18_02405 [Candidatus Woesearchaeota archaeon CG10_big_fil_rev_8_21_14_0_10_37_12]
MDATREGVNGKDDGLNEIIRTVERLKELVNPEGIVSSRSKKEVFDLAYTLRYAINGAEEGNDADDVIRDSRAALRHAEFGLYVANYGLIGYVGERLGIYLEDPLLQEAQEGLMSAVQGYDPSRGFAFTSYGYKAIKNRVLRALRIQRKDGVSLWHPAGENGDLIDGLASSQKTPLEILSEGEVDRLRDCINSALSGLSFREKQVVSWYFGLTGDRHTLEEIGRTFNFSRERVRQIKKGALNKLSQNKKLEDMYALLD